MKHLKLTNKDDQTILVHVESLIEAFPAKDGEHSVCVLDIKKRDGDQTFLLVNETTDNIYAQMQDICYEGEED